MSAADNTPEQEAKQPDTQEVVAPAADVGKPKRNALSGASLGFLVNIVFSVLAALITVAAYQYLLAPKTPRIGTVDIMMIMEAFDAPAIKAIKEGNMEAAQKAAEDRAKVAMKLEKVLEELSKKENMVFIQKQALIGSGVPDMTAETIQLLGAAQ